MSNTPASPRRHVSFDNYFHVRNLRRQQSRHKSHNAGSIELLSVAETSNHNHNNNNNNNSTCSLSEVRYWCQEAIDSTAFLVLVSTLIVTDLTFFILSFTPVISVGTAHTTSVVIVCLFMAELFLRSIAFYDTCFKDFWSLLDGAIILLAFTFDVLIPQQNASQAVIFLRMIRVVRIAIAVFMRGGDAVARLNGARSSPLEDVVQRLYAIINSNRLTPGQTEDVNEVIELLLKEELYDPMVILDAVEADDVKLKSFIEQGFTKKHNNQDRSSLMLRKSKSSPVVQRHKRQSLVSSTTTTNSNSNNNNNNNNSDEKKHQERESLLHEAHEAALLKERQADPFFGTWKGTRSVTGFQHIANPTVQLLLKESSQWTFNVFLLEQQCNTNALLMLGFYFFYTFDLFSALNIKEHTLKNLLFRIQVGYSTENPYHNSTHGADVLQTMKWILMEGGIHVKFKMTKLELVAAFLAAAAHDYGHLGLTNKFLADTSHPWALTYNDTAVAENYHAASLFRMLRDPTCNIMHNFAIEDTRIVRDCVLQMILGTDMAKHFTNLSKFKASLLATEDGLPKCDTLAERQEILNMCLHACDISAQCKPLPLATIWGARCIEEFFLQGDKEKKLNFTVSSMFDRSAPDVGKCQRGFVQYIVKPLWETLLPACVTSEAHRTMILGHLDINQTFWGGIPAGRWDGPLEYSAAMDGEQQGQEEAEEETTELDADRGTTVTHLVVVPEQDEHDTEEVKTTPVTQFTRTPGGLSMSTALTEEESGVTAEVAIDIDAVTVDLANDDEDNTDK